MQTSEFERVATNVSWVGMILNVALTLFKLMAGLTAHSQAMISDAVHSASDILSGLIVIIGVRLSARRPDADHPYGHERFESVAAIVLAAVMASVGMNIGLGAVESIVTGAYRTAAAPGVLALVAAIVSIVGKEAMYWYTYAAAGRIRSTALRAEAWHHRSDALSSVGALMGIAGARMGANIMEPAASIVICLFILKAAVAVFWEAIDQMVDRSCEGDVEAALRLSAASQPGVHGVDMLHTRVFGNRVYADIEISTDGNLPLVKAHEIAERVHSEIERQFPQVKHVMVHVNPASGE